jgi:hypothetical protein
MRIDINVVETVYKDYPGGGSEFSTVVNPQPLPMFSGYGLCLKMLDRGCDAYIEEVHIC